MKYLFPILLLSLMIGSCCKDNSDLIPGQDFIPDDILKDIKANGQIIYDGFDPPMIEGRYLMTPVLLVSSNFNDPLQIGHQFVDACIEFTEFNPNNLTLKANINEGGELDGHGYGGFISGKGDNFTIYIKLENEDKEGHKVLQADVYSGTLEPGGIRNLQRSVFMIDDHGDPNGDYIENGQGRLAKDGDGFSEKITSPCF
ncbi:MAG: hypothetical protein H6577_16150 [Lewinellaceae bacterium]|nr:hypothetical protein [Saprospiraceae bacterium]MCB9339661.1 hypothetical protein [Lewinellaceae bacterium]